MRIGRESTVSGVYHRLKRGEGKGMWGKRVGFEKSGKGGMIGRSLRCKSRLRLGLKSSKDWMRVVI